MATTSRSQQERQIEDGIAYAKASLRMSGLYMSAETEELIRQYGQGKITEKQLFEELGRE